MWTTTNELDIEGYEIFRSVDGVQFDKIGFGGGKNNGAMIYQYSFGDLKISTKAYYRIRVIERDGKASNCKILFVENTNEDKESYSIFPNPNNGLFAVENNSDAPVNMMIYNNQGAAIKSLNVPAGIKGENIQELPVGMYSIRLFGKNQTNTIRIIKN